VYSTILFGTYHLLIFSVRVDKNADGRITAEEVKEVCQKNQEFKI
jgi:hypothetical protein